MSLLDNDEILFKSLDDCVERELFHQIALQRSSMDFKHKPNIKGEIAFDAFNREINVGDWAIYNDNIYGRANNYVLVKVNKITNKQVNIIKCYHGYNRTEFINTTVSGASLIKISDKEIFYKEFIKINYINKN